MFYSTWVIMNDLAYYIVSEISPVRTIIFPHVFDQPGQCNVADSAIATDDELRCQTAAFLRT